MDLTQRLMAAALALALAWMGGAARASEVKEDLAPQPYHFHQAESTAERTAALVGVFGEICSEIDTPNRIPMRAAERGFVAAPSEIAAHVLRGEQGFVWAGMRVGLIDSFLIYNARRRICVLALREPLDREVAIRAFRRLIEAIPRSATTPEDRSLTIYGENVRGMMVETVPAAASPDRMPRSMLMSVDGSGRWEAPVVFVHGILWRDPRG